MHETSDVGICVAWKIGILGVEMAAIGSTIRRTHASLSDDEEGAAPQPGLLVVYSSGKPLWSIIPMPSGESEIELGRDNLGDEVGDGRMSRRHARVIYKDGAFLAMDLGSLNGTMIDGHRAPPNEARPLERCLRVGDTLLLPERDINPLRSANLVVNGGMVIGPRLHNVYQRIARVAPSSLTLHITGESGSGKENAARTFHGSSPVSRGPFVAVNCATIPEGIAERLLFGAKRGAFSGIVADTDGYIQAADGGTLFLDEVAEIHPTVQAKLLRVLENREVLALGALKPQPVNIRVCSASHRSLHAEVAAGRLREDLFFRIGRPSERIPALRERPEEIPWLVDLELRKVSSKLVSHVSIVEACLLRYWPGNVRELLVEVRSAAQEALAKDSSRVKSEHLSASAGLAISTQRPSAPQIPVLAEAGPVTPLPVVNPPPAPEPPSKVEHTPPSRAQLIAALIESKGNISAAARELGLHRTQLRRQIGYHGIDLNRLRDFEKA